MSVWGIGSPRSGTVTLAYLLNGIHEPKPLLVPDAGAYWRGEEIASLQGKIIERLELGVPVVDPLQSFVIPAIRSVDSGAEFIVMLRDPVACIRSLVARGTYVIDTAGNRSRPAPRRWPKSYGSIHKCTWFWCETYRVILDSLPAFEVRKTEELPTGVVLNADNRVASFELSAGHRRRIKKETAEVYEAVERRGQRS